MSFDTTKSVNGFSYNGTTIPILTNTKQKTITANGTYLASSESVDGFSSVTVNIPACLSVSTMPIASSSTTSAIYKYTGATNDDFKKDKYYITILQGDVYSWALVNEEDLPSTGKAMLIIYAIKNNGAALADKTITITNTTSNVSYTLTSDRNGKAVKEVDAGEYTIEITGSESGYNMPDTKTVTVSANQIDYTYLVYAQSISSTFGENTWAQINSASAAIASGNMTEADILATYGWAVGDVIEITLNTGEVVPIRIIGFNHDTLSSDHTTKAGISFQTVNCLATRMPMNTSSTNAGGWGASIMRTSTLPTIKATLPSELQSVIKLVDKKAANGGGSNYSATETYSDDLFLLAGVEVFGSGTSYGYAQDGANEGSQYSYWASHNTSADRIKNYDTNADGIADTATGWWERSATSSNTIIFCYVYTSGTAIYTGAYNSRGVAFGFCV